MSAFDTHQAALNGAVFDQYGTYATRTGFPKPVRVVLNVDLGEANGVSYTLHTAMVYRADAEFSISEQITVDGQSWIIDQAIERDELTTTYAVRKI